VAERERRRNSREKRKRMGRENGKGEVGV